MEKASILHLVDAVFLVIACGGGIPVVKQGEGSYVGVLAVIDKDYASECLAEIIDAEYLYISPLWTECASTSISPIRKRSRR